MRFWEPFYFHIGGKEVTGFFNLVRSWQRWVYHSQFMIKLVWYCKPIQQIEDLVNFFRMGIARRRRLARGTRAGAGRALTWICQLHLFLCRFNLTWYILCSTFKTTEIHDILLIPGMLFSTGQGWNCLQTREQTYTTHAKQQPEELHWWKSIYMRRVDWPSFVFGALVPRLVLSPH